MPTDLIFLLFSSPMKRNRHVFFFFLNATIHLLMVELFVELIWMTRFYRLEFSSSEICQFLFVDVIDIDGDDDLEHIHIHTRCEWHWERVILFLPMNLELSIIATLSFLWCIQFLSFSHLLLMLWWHGGRVVKTCVTILHCRFYTLLSEFNLLGLLFICLFASH